MIKIIFILFFVSYSVQAKKYAVVINGGDAEEGEISAQLRASTEATIDQYKKKGYEVIVIDANNGDTAQTFKTKLSSLKDVDSIDLSIYSHGTLIENEVPPHLKARFPKSNFRPDEAVSKISQENREGSLAYSYVMIKPNQEASVESFLGLGDLHDTLIDLKIQNPKMQTTLRSLSCFGGNAIRALHDIPDLQVLSSTSGHKIATSYDRADYTTYLREALEKGLNFTQAHEEARKNYLELTLKSSENNKMAGIEHMGDKLTVPQSSIDLHFEDLCLGAPKDTEMNYCPVVPDPSFVPLDNLTRNVAKIGIHGYLKTYIKTNEEFFNKLSPLYRCEFKMPPLAPFIKAALDEAKRIAKTPRAVAVSSMKSKIETIKNAKTFKQLRPYAFHELMEKDMDLFIKYDNNDTLEENRTSMLNFYESTLNFLDSDLHEEKIKMHLADLEKEVPECVDCIPSALIYKWIEPLSTLYSNITIGRRGFRPSQNELLSKRCPLIKGNQLKCILLEKDPFAKLLMLSELSEPKEDDVRRKEFCDQLIVNKAKNESLKQCLTTIDKKGDQAFWLKMLNLQTLGQKKI